MPLPLFRNHPQRIVYSTPAANTGKDYLPANQHTFCRVLRCVRRDEPGDAPPFLDILKRTAIVCNLAAERLIFIEAQNENTVAVTQTIPAGPH
ncbi:hypothetical protein MRO89_06435 [Dickeya dianthicola]|uniref:hypothetical protein n=1 Tax=Dickeya dianthicola TaxID=204039 RepID=UPI001F6129F0|nr:hypothetical protein [Dickeya dianthicola]MCI4185608.1 hypothetical protein [Dickeya dianthicola]